MGVRAGSIARASEVAQLVLYAESDENHSTSAGEPAELIEVEDVLLRSDLVYRVYGRTRARPTSGDDFGKLFVARLVIGGVTIDEARNNVDNSTSTAATNWVATEHPAWSPTSTGPATVQLIGQRGSTPSWTGHADFRGSGGPEFTHRLAIYSVGRR